MVGLAAARGLVAAAGELACLVPQRDQAAQVDRDVVGLPDIEREGGAGQGLAEQLAAQGGGGTAGAGDDLQDLGQDLVFQLGQGGGGRGGDLCGLLGAAGGGAGQPGGDGGGALASWAAMWSWVPGPGLRCRRRGVCGAGRRGLRA